MRTTVQSGAFGRPVAVSRSRVLLIVCLITAIVVWMDILAPELDQQLFGGTFQALWEFPPKGRYLVVEGYRPKTAYPPKSSVIRWKMCFRLKMP